MSKMHFLPVRFNQNPLAGLAVFPAKQVHHLAVVYLKHIFIFIGCSIESMLVMHMV